MKPSIHSNMIVEILDDGNSKKIQIKNLKIEDKIKTVCPNTKSIIYNMVKNIQPSPTIEHDQEVQLEFFNGSIINCSCDHPIMVLDGTKIIQKFPNDLTYDDLVITDDCGTVYLKSITIGSCNGQYFQVTVENHTFYTSASYNSPMILV